MNTRSSDEYLHKHRKTEQPSEYIWTYQRKSLKILNSAENGLQHGAISYQFGKSIWANHCHHFLYELKYSSPQLEPERWPQAQSPHWCDSAKGMCM